MSFGGWFFLARKAHLKQLLQAAPQVICGVMAFLGAGAGGNYAPRVGFFNVKLCLKIITAGYPKKMIDGFGKTVAG